MRHHGGGGYCLFQRDTPYGSVYNYCKPDVFGKDVYDEKIRRGIIGAGILGIKWLAIHAATDFDSPTPVRSSRTIHPK
jgi:hypothetical protein